MTADTILELARSKPDDWRDVVGYEGYYQVSNTGKVRSVDRVVARSDGKMQNCKGKILSLIDRRGYLHVNLCKDLKTKSVKVHRLVAMAFIPNPSKLPIINHKDENPKNNRVENLEWCDVKYNSNYGTRNEKVSQNTRNAGKRVHPVVATSITTGCRIYFPSINEAQRHGFSACCVSACCTGRSKTHMGYTWKYDNGCDFK